MGRVVFVDRVTSLRFYQCTPNCTSQCIQQVCMAGAKFMPETLAIQLVGDLILDEPNPDALFDLSRKQLGASDVLVGHVEVPHTARGIETHFDVPAPASDPANLAALQRAGFHVATLGGNHIADAGPNGVEDTVT